MTGVAFYGLLQSLVTLYTLWRGGWPERLVGAITGIAWLATWLSPFNPHTGHSVIQVDIFVIDLLLAAILILIALKADRYWPIWVSTLQVLTISFHGVRWYDSTVLPAAYHHLTVWLAYPALAMIVVGTWRHEQRDRRRPGLTDA